MAVSNRTLGTLLRHLIELLDGAVEEGYASAQLEYRARYTPVFRSLISIGPSSIRSLARHAGLTHSAASQTIAQMARSGLVEVKRGEDMREQVVSLTTKATNMIPELRRQWLITNEAAQELDAELPYPLSRLLESTISALERQSFGERRDAIGRRQDLRAEE